MLAKVVHFLVVLAVVALEAIIIIQVLMENLDFLITYHLRHL